MTAKQGHASHPRRIRIRLTRLLAGSLAAASTTPHLPAPPPRSSAHRSSVLVRCCRCWQASPVRPGGGAGTTLRGERGQAHGCHLLSPNRCPLSASSPRRTHLPLTLKHTLSSAKSKKRKLPAPGRALPAGELSRSFVTHAYAILFPFFKLCATL